jgi:hypothetical protein
MVPMIDPMISEASMLMVVTPSLVGVMLALVGAVAVAIAGTLHELGRTQTARPPQATPPRRTSPAPLPA